MFLSNASVRRPVAMSALIIALTLLGANSYRKLGLEMMPSMDIPFVTIVAVYPGAGPLEVEADVARTIEDAVATVDGLKHTTAMCMENVCYLLVEFETEVDGDVAAADVRAKIDTIVNDLPAGVDRPKVLKFNTTSVPIISMALTGDAPVADLYDYADTNMRDRLTALPGVADVTLIGGAEREVHVLLDRSALFARVLSSTQVVQALGANVGIVPSGRLTDSGSEYSVKFDGDCATIEEIGSLEIVPGVRIRDVARVEVGSEEEREAAFVDGRPCIAMKLVKKPNANAVKVVNLVREWVNEVRAELPGGMELVWVADSGDAVEAFVDGTTSTVVFGILLTAAVLFLFLYSIRATLIVAITMPLTIVIGLYFIQTAGYTLNLSTLLALGLSVGLLVTNSILVLESIETLLVETGDPKLAAKLGASTVATAVLASVATNAVVLVPIALMGGVASQFFRPFALTMVAVTAVSLFISFTLTPILASLMLKRKGVGGPLDRIERAWAAGMDRISRRYSGVVQMLGEKRWAGALVLALTLAAFMHAMWLFPRLGFGLVADADLAEATVKVEHPTYYSLDRSVDRLKEVENLIADLPDLEHRLVTVGKVEGAIGTATEGVNLAQVLLRFSAKTERDVTLEELTATIRERLAGYTDARITVNRPTVVGESVAQIQMDISGPELDEIERLAEAGEEFARASPLITGADNSVRPGRAELRVRPIRPILADLGLPAAGLGASLRCNISGLEAATFKRDGRSYDVRVKFEEEEGKSQLGAFQSPTPAGPAGLTTLATVEESTAPSTIIRKDKSRVTRVYGDPAPGVPLGTALDTLRVGMESNAGMRPDYSLKFGAMAEQMAEIQSEFLEAGLIALLLTYLILAAILESFLQPLAILATLPLATIGMAWALWAGGESVHIFVLLGAVMLIGIVVNNAILILDRVNQLRAEGVGPHEAMRRSLAEKFRAIMMITVAAVLGMVPLAFGGGIASEMRAGIGIASIGGIAVSGVLTLLVLPILYDMFTRKRTAPALAAQEPEAQSEPAPREGDGHERA